MYELTCKLTALRQTDTLNIENVNCPSIARTKLQILREYLMKFTKLESYQNK